jgi:large subunit ribosomal protein L9
MNVILKENVENLGSIGEIVRVSNGYARNYLFPRSLAVIANEHQVEQVAHQKRALTKKLALVKAEKEALKTQVEAISIVIRRKTGENQKLFGSITAQDIADAVEQKGLKLERKQIELGGALKKLGTFKVAVRLMEGVVANLNLSVVADVE